MDDEGRKEKKIKNAEAELNLWQCGANNQAKVSFAESTYINGAALAAAPHHLQWTSYPPPPHRPLLQSPFPPK